MKKYFNLLALTSIIIGLILSLNINVASVQATAVTAQSVTMSQFVDLLIAIGVIAPDKAAAARAAFATSSLPYIQVLSPNGGERWPIDGTVVHTITWGTSSQLPVNISLVPAKGAVCNLTPAAVYSRSGNNSYDLLLPSAKCYNTVTGTSSPLTANSYNVQVSYLTSTGLIVKDQSNSAIKILARPIPDLKVTYPNGAEKLVSGTYYDFRYTLTNATNTVMMLSFLNYQGNNVYSAGFTSEDGRHHLAIPRSLTAGAYKIKFEMTTSDNVYLTDTSDNFFWVTDSL